MLDSTGFDLWAGDYDKTVGITDENDLYPFAGYRDLMSTVYSMIMSKQPVTVLDIGIGTGVLAFKLYENGVKITGIDFSSEMLNITRKKMPEASLINYDFTKGLPPELLNKKFDLIVSTYALHHMTDNEKATFIPSLFELLNDDGPIIIGDVSFQNREELENCKAKYSDDWDDDEFYFVFTELSKSLSDKCSMSYHQISHCAGILEVSPFIQK